MGISSKYKKRILTFMLIPILLTILFLTDDFLTRIITSLILVIYIGFIIFLRDNTKEVSEETHDEPIPSSRTEESLDLNTDHQTDEGEGFKIVSNVKRIEVLTTENMRAYFPPNKGHREVFKPSDIKENFQKIALEELPKDVSHDEQFGFLLEKILSVLKDAFIAHTAAFFWYNKKRQRLTLERYVSSSSAITRQKFDLEDDILGKIIQNEEPELLTDISPNAESDVIRYYNVPQGIKSFVGVPLFYGKNLTGLLVLDSKDKDAFGIEQIYSLGKIVRVISIIISLFEDKFSESQAEQRLKALTEILEKDRKFESEKDIFEVLDKTVEKLLDWDVFTFVLYNPLEQKFKTSRIINKTSLKYVGENLEVELKDTLVGKSIMSSIPVKIDDTTQIDLPRFNRNEDVSFDGSFLAIPLIYDEQNYGVLCFESLKKNYYSNSEVTFVKNATKIFAFILYSHASINVLKNLLAHDVETKVLNYQSFIERLTVDLVRSKELALPGALALIKIDDFIEEDSLFDGNPFPKVLKAISQMIRDEMTPMNLIGRLSERVFAVYFFNTAPKDVFLWAEKLRIKVARKPISVVSKQTTFTISVGVASTTNKTDVGEILSNAELALNKALEKGGNTVKSL
ncbi:GAF domain-containing protein [Melioribacter sp. OK-6-Me]|uniref:sensor domain-containing diguanylate cyclase n=1 Tax=unclassified Melioribacter TaxID=2627329 RepID=UPI003EDAA7AB